MMMEACKENLPPKSSCSSSSSSSQILKRQGLSLEQRRRIDQNFRAAKAILGRKRSFNEVSPSQKQRPCPPSSSPRLFSSAHVQSKDTCLSLAVANKRSVPLHVEEAIIQDSDFDEKTLMQLDSFCTARVPLVQLPTNKRSEPSLSLNSQEGLQLSCLSLERAPITAEVLSTEEERSCKSCPPSPSGVDSSKISVPVTSKKASFSALPTAFALLEKPLEYRNNQTLEEASHNQTLDEAKQSCTASVCFDASVSDQHASSGLSQSSSGLSISCQNLGGEVKPNSTSEVDLPRQTLSIMVGSDTAHVSPSLSILESCSNEFPADSFKNIPAYLEALNDTQREAVLCDTQKPLLILAGPGSGKTSTMVARLLHLLNEGMQPANILAMTFTIAAAAEMRERVGAHVGKSVSRELNVCTFHSFCLQLCRSNAEKLGRSSDFLVYGHGQQKKAVIEATRLALPEVQSVTDFVGCPPNGRTGSILDQDIDPRLLRERAKKWDKFVAQAKASGHTPQYFENLGNVSGAAILRHYNATLAACDALDYHDFINYSVALLRDDDEILKQCLLKWNCLLVDEFQDTSKMQYELLRLLASHKRITVVGDDDQSIFSFNGADSKNFDGFRKDFSNLKEVRLQHNYRSTRCIVEAAAALIGNNVKRCENKCPVTDNDIGDLISVKECRNDDAQCCFAIDTIITSAHKLCSNKPNYGNFAILYRRQVTGKNFQTSLRSRKIPFNVHGVAFYRKKIVKTVVSMLWTAVDSSTVHCRRVFKALFGSDRAEAKKVVEYVDKVANASQTSYLEAARKIFFAKISGMFCRRQLGCGRKVLSVIDAVNSLVRKEPTLSAVVTTVVNLTPQRAAFQKKAVLDVDEGKFLNEDDDPRTVLEYLLDDVTDFLGIHIHDANEAVKVGLTEENGCQLQLKLFLDHIAIREQGNFRNRREDNKHSVTLTTLHQSKGLEWDTVFIVKANDSEIPLLHEARGSISEGAMSIEEERRLFYVGMTRAKKKLYILYITWDSTQQLLQPSRFLKELPCHLIDFQVFTGTNDRTVLRSLNGSHQQRVLHGCNNDLGLEHDKRYDGEAILKRQKESDLIEDSSESNCIAMEMASSTDFLKGFNLDARSTIASIFHTWARKPAFHDPKRLLNKVCFVLDERIRNRTSKNKETLRALKCCLDSHDAFLYAQHVLKWMEVPHEERIILQSEKQEFFQKKCAERAMTTAAATSKQVSYLRMLGCTIDPTSRLHASRLIEQYRKL